MLIPAMRVYWEQARMRNLDRDLGYLALQCMLLEQSGQFVRTKSGV